jgi:Uri superfamily endonuclease
MDKGIYCLVFFSPGCTVRVGALGDVTFRRGWYIYVGSALGSGGLARLRRHISLSHSKDRRPKWHVDYLSTGSHFTLMSAVHAVTEDRLECRLAGALGGPGIPGFGSGDCHCPSHLFYRTLNPVPEIECAIRSLGKEPVTTIIKNP